MRILSALFVSIFAALALGQGGPDPWQPSELMQPKDVVAMLARKPAVFHVGFASMFRNGRHIPGAVYAGPGGRDEGLALLRQTAAKLPRDREIVIYCGCCPWDKCPNMRPAFRVLKEMGFTRVRAMYVPTNFAKDWLDKGYPAEMPR